MYQVTIICQECEVGYGEGFTLDDAKLEAFDSLSIMDRDMMLACGYQLAILAP